jgi:hypothetical protein
LSAETLTYLDSGTFSSVIYYNMLSLLLLMITLSFFMELLLNYCYRMDRLVSSQYLCRYCSHHQYSD